MKLRTTLAFALAFGAITSFASLALAQTAPASAAVAAAISTQTAVVTVIALIAGFIGQAINSGSFFGIATTPKAWIPYLTLLGSFLAAFGLSLQSAAALNGSAWFNAVIAGFMALTSAAGGSAAHNHLNAHKKFVPAAPAAPAAPATPAAADSAPTGGGK